MINNDYFVKKVDYLKKTVGENLSKHRENGKILE
jgi:hypothetical protein